MNDFSTMMITRSEHQHMIDSMPTVYEFGANIQDAQPGLASRLAGRLMSVLGSALTSWGKRLSNDYRAALDATTPATREQSIHLK